MPLLRATGYAYCVFIGRYNVYCCVNTRICDVQSQVVRQIECWLRSIGFGNVPLQQSPTNNTELLVLFEGNSELLRAVALKHNWRNTPLPPPPPPTRPFKNQKPKNTLCKLLYVYDYKGKSLYPLFFPYRQSESTVH